MDESPNQKKKTDGRRQSVMMLKSMMKKVHFEIENKVQTQKEQATEQKLNQK